MGEKKEREGRGKLASGLHHHISSTSAK